MLGGLLSSAPCRGVHCPKKYSRSGSREASPRSHSASLLLLGTSSFWVEEGTSHTDVSSLVPFLSKVTHLLSLAGLGEGAHLLWNPQYSLLLRGPAVYHQLVGTSCSSLSILHYMNVSDCPIAHGCQTIHRRQEQPNLSMWPSSRVAATSAWQWVSLATLRASSWDSCHLCLKWLEVACILHWNSGQGSDLEIPADPHPGSSGWAGPHLCWRCFFSESRISWQISSISRSHNTILGALFSWYTLLYSAPISSQVVL